MTQHELIELQIVLERLGNELRTEYEADPTEDNDRKVCTIEAAFDIVDEIIERLHKDERS